MTQHQQQQTGSEQQIIVRLVGGVPFVEHSTWFKEREQAAFEGKLGRSEAKDFHSALASESRRMAEARDALREVDFRHLAPVAQLAVLKREGCRTHTIWMRMADRWPISACRAIIVSRQNRTEIRAAIRLLKVTNQRQS